MFAKLIVVVVLAAVALAREYPAGVHPAICPDYPFCDATTLARYNPDGTPIPEWVYNPSILPVAPMQYPAAAKYPADFPQLSARTTPTVFKLTPCHPCRLLTK